MATYFDVMNSNSNFGVALPGLTKKMQRPKLSRPTLNHCGFSLKRFYFILFVRLVSKVKIVLPLFYTTKQPKANDILEIIIIIIIIY